MDESNFIYINKLRLLGDKILEISKSIPKYDVLIKIKDYNKLKDSYNILITAINGYKECKLDLESIVPVEIIKKEHEEMISAFQLFIDGAQILVEAIDIIDGTINEFVALNGWHLQTKGETNTLQITERIAQALSK